jgi:hypothetical protein
MSLIGSTTMTNFPSRKDSKGWSIPHYRVDAVYTQARLRLKAHLLDIPLGCKSYAVRASPPKWFGTSFGINSLIHVSKTVGVHDFLGSSVAMSFVNELSRLSNHSTSCTISIMASSAIFSHLHLK